MGDDSSELSDADTDRMYDLHTALCDWIGSKDAGIAKRVLAMLAAERSESDEYARGVADERKRIAAEIEKLTTALRSMSGYNDDSILFGKPDSICECLNTIATGGRYEE